MNELLDKLKNFEDKYNKLIEKLSSPEVTSNPEISLKILKINIIN